VSETGNLYCCGHCGAIHGGTCSRIKAIDYYPDGTIKRVEYHAELPFSAQLDRGIQSVTISPPTTTIPMEVVNG